MSECNKCDTALYTLSYDDILHMFLNIRDVQELHHALLCLMNIVCSASYMRILNGHPMLQPSKNPKHNPCNSTTCETLVTSAGM